MAGGFATPNQLYRLNKLGLLVVGEGKPLNAQEADAAIRASGWTPEATASGTSGTHEAK